MSRLLTAGAEGNDATLDGISIGGATVVSDVVRSGVYAYKCTTDSFGNAAAISFVISRTLGRTYYHRMYVRFDGLPASGSVDIITVSGFTATITSGGALQLWNSGTSTQVGSDSATTIVVGTWYRIELSAKIQSGASDDSAELRLDGITVATATNVSAATGDTGQVSMGWAILNANNANNTLRIDDIAVNDDQGANPQNSWPGEGKIVLLVPTSDNARATLWTGGAGGTTNLFDAVDNKPPVGTATETNTTQIEHAGSAAGSTDAYDANMTTYSAAGIVTGDTISLIQVVDADGEDVSTGSKHLQFSVVSNPAIATAGSILCGEDAGALGTYPSAWTAHQGTPSYVPTVTLGTAPVMRAMRPETTSRVASVCFMGMLVEYVHIVATYAPPVYHRRSHFWRR